MKKDDQCLAHSGIEKSIVSLEIDLARLKEDNVEIKAKLNRGFGMVAALAALPTIIAILKYLTPIATAMMVEQ